MKPWRDILALCVSVVVMLAVASCGGHSDRPGLVALDSLILQDPDSACELLAAYPADSLLTADDRAYHALLTTIADYKAYRPITTDSVINIALFHYDHNGANQDKRMRSLLYKGCVMEELGDPKEAMRCYKEAQYTCPDNDNFHKGYIHFRIGGLYQQCSEINQAINNYKRAYIFFNRASNEYYEQHSIKIIGALYRNTNIDSAYYYINLSISLAKKSNDKELLYEAITNLAGYYYNNKEYHETIKYAMIALNEGKEYLHDNYAYFFALQSFLEEGQSDSAQYVLSIFPEPNSPVDSMQYFRCIAELQRFNKQSNLAFDTVFIADSLENELSTNGRNNGLIKIEAECDKVVAQNKTIKRIIAVSIAIILLVILSSLFFFKNRYLKTQTEDLLEEISKLNIQINDSFLKIKKLKQDQINIEYKFQEQVSSINLINEKAVSNTIHKIDLSIECYSSLMEKLLRIHKLSSGEKNKKIREILSEEFFKQLHEYVDLRFNTLIEKLKSPQYKLTIEEINIICLELCKFPASIIWIYSDCDRIHSVYRKKKQIAAKVNNSNTIADIPDNI